MLRAGDQKKTNQQPTNQQHKEQIRFPKRPIKSFPNKYIF